MGYLTATVLTRSYYSSTTGDLLYETGEVRETSTHDDSLWQAHEFTKVLVSKDGDEVWAPAEDDLPVDPGHTEPSNGPGDPGTVFWTSGPGIALIVALAGAPVGVGLVLLWTRRHARETGTEVRRRRGPRKRKKSKKPLKVIKSE